MTIQLKRFPVVLFVTLCKVVQTFKSGFKWKLPGAKFCYGAVFYALKQGQESFELLSLWMKSFSGPDYVQWKPLYTVSYEAQAGSNSESVNGTQAYVYSVSI